MTFPILVICSSSFWHVVKDQALLLLLQGQMNFLHFVTDVTCVPRAKKKSSEIPSEFVWQCLLKENFENQLLSMMANKNYNNGCLFNSLQTHTQASFHLHCILWNFSFFLYLHRQLELPHPRVFENFIVKSTFLTWVWGSKLSQIQVIKWL
jgi:hypothetical protein